MRGATLTLSNFLPFLTILSLPCSGIVRTDLFGHFPLWKKLFLLPMYPFTIARTQGAFNQLWAATVPRSELNSGAYYLPVGEETAVSGKALDQDQGDRLWEWTEAELEPWVK